MFKCSSIQVDIHSSIQVKWSLQIGLAIINNVKSRDSIGSKKDGYITEA